MNCYCRNKVAIKMNQTVPKLKWLNIILCSHLDTYSQRQINMTELLFFPQNTQHGSHLRGMEVSNHPHASADLTLMTKHPSVPQLVIQPH